MSGKSRDFSGGCVRNSLTAEGPGRRPGNHAPETGGPGCRAREDPDPTPPALLPWDPSPRGSCQRMANGSTNEGGARQNDAPHPCATGASTSPPGSGLAMGSRPKGSASRIDLVAWLWYNRVVCGCPATATTVSALLQELPRVPRAADVARQLPERRSKAIIVLPDAVLATGRPPAAHAPCAFCR